MRPLDSNDGAARSPARLDRGGRSRGSIAGVDRLSGLTISAAQMALDAIRSGEGTGKPASLRTCAAHHRSLKTFTRWLTRDGRMTVDPLLYLSGYNVDTDRRVRGGPWRRTSSTG